MNNIKLMNLVEGSLRSTEDYVNALKNVPELKSYLELHVLFRLALIPEIGLNYHLYYFILFR